MKIKTFIELEIEVHADYVPARPAPPCQDHDSPRYSDSGDDEYCEITDMKFVIPFVCDTIKAVDIPPALEEYIADTIIDDVITACREQHEREEYDFYIAEISEGEDRRRDIETAEYREER